MKMFSRILAKSWWGGAIGFLAEWLVFGLLALAVTRPLAEFWTTAIPQGSSTPAVSLFNLWTLGWNVDRLEHGLDDYWNAPIFHPAEDAFALSEPQPLMMLTAPVVWAGGTLAMAYNLYLWLGLSLTGVITSRLVHRLTRSWLAAWTGGAMLVGLPFLHWQMAYIQVVPLVGVVGTISALAWFGEEPTIKRSLLLGSAFAVTYFLCNYYGLFLSVLLILSGAWLFGRNLWNGRLWLKLIPGALWCLVLIGPMILHQRAVSAEYARQRPAGLIEDQSAEWRDFTSAPWPQLLPLPEHGRPGWTLSPGYLKMALAVLGLVWGLYARPLRRMTLFLAMFVGFSLVLAQGPKFQLAGWTPYAWLFEHYPGFSMARNVFRFAVFAQIGIAVLAAFGIDGLWNLLVGDRQSWKRPEEPAVIPADVSFQKRLIVVIALAFLAVIEVWPSAPRLFDVPDLERERRWLTWIENNTDPEDPIAHIPFPKGRQAGDYFPTVLAMYFGLEHHRPLVNGFSGLFPEEYLRLNQAMARFPDPHSLDRLEDSGARYCIVSRKSFDRRQIESHPLARQVLQWRFGDEQAGIDIYEFLPNRRPR